MAAIEPFESNHAFQSLEVNSNTMFEDVTQTPLLTPFELPPEVELTAESVSASPDQLSEDDLGDLYMFKQEAKQEKAGFMDRARAFRGHLSDKSFQLGEKLFLTKEGLPDQARAAQAHLADSRYRVGEALSMARIDLPDWHEHSTIKRADGFKETTNATANTIKDYSAATVKSLGSSSANVVSQAVLQNRGGNVLRAVREDFSESDHKVRALALGAAVVATETFDRLRGMVFVVPHVVSEVMDSTHSPVQTAIIGSGVYAAWNIFSGEVLNQGLNILPKAKEKFREEFPVAVRGFRDSLPGANREVVAQEKANAQEKGVGRRVGSFLLRHAGRGGTGISIGTTAFVATSSVAGDTTGETRKQYMGVSADTYAVLGGVILGVTQAIAELPKHNMAGVSEFLYNGVTNMKFWGAVALASMGLQYASSQSIRKKMEAEDNELVVLDNEEDGPYESYQRVYNDEPIPHVTYTDHEYFVNQKNAGKAAHI